jgi:hypothetical protein
MLASTLNSLNNYYIGLEAVIIVYASTILVLPITYLIYSYKTLMSIRKISFYLSTSSANVQDKH